MLPRITYNARTMDTIIFTILILILSVVAHEVAHGYAALWLGDTTAKYSGRLTLNPIKHLDPIGSVFLPLMLALLPGGFIFGWAKPVPYNPYNLKNRRWGEVIVAAAGPLTNFLIAFIFGLVIRFSSSGFLSNSFFELSLAIVVINIVLAIFNLMPIPPLDGSKILFGILPQRYSYIKDNLERAGFFLVLLFVFFLWQFFVPLIGVMVKLFSGVSF